MCRNRFNASSVSNLREKLSRNAEQSFPYNAMIPVGPQLVLPWNGSLIKQLPKRLDKIGTLLDGMQLKKNSPQTEAALLSDLTLMPSPGEQFSLTIACLDQLLNEVDSTIFAQVRFDMCAPKAHFSVRTCFLKARTAELKKNKTICFVFLLSALSPPPPPNDCQTWF